MPLRTVTRPPRGVYLSALSIRLASRSSSSQGSPLTLARPAPRPRSMPAWSARSQVALHQLLTSGSSATGWNSPCQRRERLGARQRQQLIGRMRQRLRGALQRAELGSDRRGARLVLQQLDLRQQARDRSAHLMGGVGHEAPLGQRGIVQQLQHAVECHDQRAQLPGHARLVEALQLAAANAPSACSRSHPSGRRPK